jgi:hypothetical protein
MVAFMGSKVKYFFRYHTLKFYTSTTSKINTPCIVEVHTVPSTQRDTQELLVAIGET